LIVPTEDVGAIHSKLTYKPQLLRTTIPRAAQFSARRAPTSCIDRYHGPPW